MTAIATNLPAVADGDYKSHSDSRGKNKEDEATIAGEIIGPAGDESPLNGGEERGSEARLFIHPSNIQRAQVFLLGSTGN